MNAYLLNSGVSFLVPILMGIVLYSLLRNKEVFEAKLEFSLTLIFCGLSGLCNAILWLCMFISTTNPITLGAERAAAVGLFLFFTPTSFFYITFLLKKCYVSKKASKIITSVLSILVLISSVFSITNIFRPVIFDIIPGQGYVRYKEIPIFEIVYIFNVVFVIVSCILVVYARKKNLRSSSLIYLVYPVGTMIISIIQVLFNSFSIVNIICCVGLILVYWLERKKGNGRRISLYIISGLTFYVVFILFWFVIFQVDRFGINDRKIESDEIITVGVYDDNEPYSYVDDTGKASGFDVEIAYGLGEKLGSNIDIIVGNFQELKSELVSGQIDFLMGVSNNEKSDSIKVSNSLISDDLGLYARKDSNAYISENDRIAVLKGSYESDMNVLQKYFSTIDEAQLVGYDNYNDCLEAVQNGDVKFAIVSDNIYKHAIAKGNAIDVECKNNKWLTVLYGVGVNANQNELLDEINLAILDLHTDGRIKEVKDSLFEPYDKSDFYIFVSYNGMKMVLLFVLIFAICFLVEFYIQKRSIKYKDLLLQQKEQLLVVEKEKKNAEIESLKMIKSLTNLFVTIGKIDVVNDVCENIQAAEKVAKYIKKQSTFSEALNLVIKNDLKPVVAAEYESYLRADRIIQKLNDRDVLVYELPVNSYGWVQFNFAAVSRDEYGKVLEILWLTRIINEEKIRELEMNKSLEKALSRAAKASAAKTEFLSAMSHDIRTPMNAIIGMIDIALKHENEPDVVKDCLTKIDMAGNQLKALINDVLDISAIESGKLAINKVPYRISDIYSEINDVIFGAYSQNNVEIFYEYKEPIINVVMIDELRFNQICNNLISNAVKYTQKGGKVRIESWQEIDVNDKSWEVFRVSDNGIGMSKDFMDNMWNSFSRATDTRVNKIQGTGLGLSIVKTLVELMNGEIFVKSKINEGSIFAVRIPIEAAKEDVLLIKEGENNVKNDISYNILLAEDNDMNWEIAKELFEFEGISVERATNGKECLEKFNDSKSNEYDAIVMDIMMPVMNGLEATKEIRKLSHENAKTIPIIAMSANAFQEDIEKSLKAGMNEHLSKPIDMDKVLIALKKHVG